MAGFDWNQFYTIFKAKLEKAVKCTVGRYITPSESKFPYCDIAFTDNPGSNYDLEGNESTTTPFITIAVYSNGSLADSTCEKISKEAKKIMLSYGFQCRFGPAKVDNADSNISRWVGRYQRVFDNNEELKQL